MTIRILILALGYAILGACAPQVLNSTSSGGLIKTAGVMHEQTKAIETANAECAKFGKVAKVTRTDILSDTVAYDCVAK